MAPKNPSGLGPRRRRGAVTVEFACIASIVFLLLIGFLVMALGVFRYQQVAYLAREGARYASTHGSQYHMDCRLPAGNQTSWTQEIRENAVLPDVAALNPARLTVTASWSAGDNRANAGDPATDYQTTIKNTVTVTVTYQWFPEAYLIGPFELRSTASAPMTY